MTPAAVIILAAGEGTRMRSATPKPLFELAGRTLLGHAVTAALGLNPELLVVVVRHCREQVAAHALELAPGAIIADQDEIPGTGRAAQCALAALDQATQGSAGQAAAQGPIVVMAADTPLLDAGTLRQLVRVHAEDRNAATVLTAGLQDPTGYGRIVRDPATGLVREIVEERDATPEQRAIEEVNSSTYVFDAGTLRDAIARLTQDNDQHELYLTDVIAHAHRAQARTAAIMVEDPWTVQGINDRAQLAAVGRELNRRLTEQAMLDGVTIWDPATTWLDCDIRLDQDVTLLPGTRIKTGCVIEHGAVVGPGATLEDTHVGPGARVNRVVAIGADIGPDANVGPFTYLRPGATLRAGSKAGAYTEIKNATIGEGAKVPHLSYVGDAEIGEGTNIGASTVFANYDGVHKHHTTVGPHARIGSDTMLVAPVTVGAGAYTAAGSVIKDDVPPGALALSQPRQTVIEGWVARKRAGTPAAEAAARATRETAAPGSVTGITENEPVGPQPPNPSDDAPHRASGSGGPPSGAPGATS
ncbi:MAG: bifunctional UDP-N-acetylglucosamine diphosphorylase/glucosamine-1-phosphate N-acetyltransferase GlmU [Bifidobacteriaceae bacterium]|nr:bifunctional UDP-N-acetylglucosamine diphosphorylase/glucosamine-1-phosphate N-acetyltransferase GlmU [Bifidobacteriaceae bacterium]